MKTTKALFVRHFPNLWFRPAHLQETGIICDFGLNPMVNGKSVQKRINTLTTKNQKLLSTVKVVCNSTDLRVWETAKPIAWNLNVSMVPYIDLRSVGMPMGEEAVAFVKEYKATGTWHHMWLSGEWGFEDAAGYIQRVEMALKLITNNSIINQGPNTVLIVGHEETVWVIETLRRIRDDNESPDDAVAILEEVASEINVPQGSIIQVEI